MGSSGIFSVTFLISLVIAVTGHPHPPCDSASGGAEIVVEFSPDPFLIVLEGVEGLVNVTIYGIVGNITVSTSIGDSNSFESFFNETVITDAVDGNVTVMIPIRGRKLSISSLILNITHVYQVADDVLLKGDVASSGDGGNEEEASVREYIETHSFTYDIKVSRQRNILEKVFTYSLLGWLIVSYVTMGSKMDLAVIWNKLRRPYGVLTGIGCQFIIMPLIAFALAKSPGITPEAAIGLLVIGSCPGGWISNIFSLLMDVDFVLSLTMTFCSSFMALGLMPLNMFIYGSRLTEGNSSGLQTPYKDIAMQLGLMLLPVGLGMYIAHKSEKIAKIMLKCLKPMSCGLIVIALAIGIPSQVYIFDVPWRIYLICCALPFCGGTLGFAISKLLRRPTKEALTISFETGVQNSLLAITVAKLSYPIPEADLIARMPLLVAMLQIFEGTVMILTYVIVRRVLIRVGKIARPDTGDYHQCDIEAKASDAVNEDDDEEDDDLHEEEKQALKALDVGDDFELKIDPCEKNGYVKMNEEQTDVEGKCDSHADVATKALPDSFNDNKAGYVKIKESTSDQENDDEVQADDVTKPEVVEIHPNENMNNNSEEQKTGSKSITHPGTDNVPKSSEEGSGAETQTPCDPAEQETNI
ncbi:uncharacterized protein LOC579660 [Strongylocentrotus purpuratus]|uniref:Ileal sodium/bile acid cotransporter n=1 Tax=Strongylocentrotus purpuratus TaxID=7668 RepID=A0A7M7HFZ9_STRPU|nr:uncharacterized protein LOC579660 [Strongylocentrotus purpuratus]